MTIYYDVFHLETGRRVIAPFRDPDKAAAYYDFMVATYGPRYGIRPTFNLCPCTS